jgi:hypothetical protein
MLMAQLCWGRCHRQLSATVGSGNSPGQLLARDIAVGGVTACRIFKLMIASQHNCWTLRQHTQVRQSTVG